MRNRVFRSVLALLVLWAMATPLAAQGQARVARSGDRPQPQVLRAAPPAAPSAKSVTLIPSVVPPEEVAQSRERPQQGVQQACNVLLVDDDWDYQYTHPGSLGGQPFYTSTLEALGLSYEVWDVQTQGQPTGAAMAGRNAVIWFTGYAYGEFIDDPGVFTSQNETRVANYLNDGGGFILSSQEYYFDCCDEPGTLTPFMQSYLGLADINDDVVVTTTLGIAGDPIGDGLGPYTMARPDDYGVYWPEGAYQGPYDDEVIKRPEAEAPFQYASPWNTGLSATSYLSDTFKTMYLGWPFEWIDTVGERAEILGRALTWMECIAPAAPTLAPIDNADGNAEYLVDWNDVMGATSYTLQEDDNSSFTSPTVRYTGANSQYQVTGQAAGTWYYRVRASNAAGDSPWSNTQSVSVIPAAPVLAPISSPDGDSSYLVDWNDVTGATSYTLQEDDNSSFTSPTLRYTGANSQYQVTGQAAGTWYYRVRAGNAGGDSPWSNVQSTSVIPAAPVLLPISNADGNGDYLVDWNDATGATSYTLQEDDNPSFNSPGERYAGPNTQYQITAQPGGTWYYRVRASNAGGDSPWTNVESVVCKFRITLPLVLRQH